MVVFLSLKHLEKQIYANIWLKQGSHNLKKSLNFFSSPRKVLEFSSTSNEVARKVIFNAFSFSKAEYCIHVNHSSETFKVIYLKRFLFYARNNFKPGELKNVEKLGEETVQALWTENVHFLTMCEITFLVGGPGKSNVVLKKSFKNDCIFLYEPC